MRVALEPARWGDLEPGELFCTEAGAGPGTGSLLLHVRTDRAVSAARADLVVMRARLLPEDGG